MIELKFCRECGAELNEKAEICPKCGVRQKQSNMKNPFYALLWSACFMGFGQFYNGEFKKGVVFIAVQTINVFLCFIVIGAVTLPITWLYGMYDAYKTAEKLNSLN